MKIIIHGGFLSELETDESTKAAKQLALERIVRDGYSFLQDHTATETAAYTVSLLEDDELFNAGTGSQLQSDGIIRMSAAIMDGSAFTMAGVINIEKVKNPVLVAEKLLPLEDKILGGFGATNFARMHGFEFYSTETEKRRNEFEEKKEASRTSTVGCVCRDAGGNIVAATSTGGKGFELPGRISDTATVAGTYANAFCGVSMTGIGEDIVNAAMAAKIVTRVTDGMTLTAAFNKTFAELKAANGTAGAIAIDNSGKMYHLDSEPTMVFASFDGQLLEIFD